MRGDLVAFTVNDAVMSTQYLLVSFHGDTNGLVILSGLGLDLGFDLGFDLGLGLGLGVGLGLALGLGLGLALGLGLGLGLVSFHGDTNGLVT